MSAPTYLTNFVAGHFEPAINGTTIESLNPSAPAEVLASFTVGDQAAVDRACSAAASVQAEWAGKAAAARGDALFHWADRVQARAEELATAIAVEVGKPIVEAKGEVGRTVALIRYYAGEAVRPSGEVIPALSSASLQYGLRVPLGVVALITPWNFPMAIPVWKAAPALALGNTVVLKPSELAPKCAQLLAETAYELPQGVLNVLLGDGTTGAMLVGNPLVKAVSFTGSIAAGQRIQAQCAGRNVRCQCEMGGKNAAVVLADADLPRAAGLVAGGAMRFAGQKCTATSRVIVQDAVFEDFLVELTKAVDALPAGPVLEPSTTIGPVIDERAHVRLNALLAEQSDVLHVAESEQPGYWVNPTIVGPVEPTAPIAQQELFGPVLAVLRCKDLDDAISQANATDFGLSTAIYTQNLAQALKYVGKVEAGLVRVNGDTTGVDLHAPFGGTKASSSGSREQGTVAKDFYTEWKTVQINP